MAVFRADSGPSMISCSRTLRVISDRFSGYSSNVWNKKRPVTPYSLGPKHLANILLDDTCETVEVLRVTLARLQSGGNRTASNVTNKMGHYNSIYSLFLVSDNAY